MPAFLDSIALSKIANPLWTRFLSEHFGMFAIDIISEEENQRFQGKKWGDFIVVLDEPLCRYQTVEVKIRTEYYYQKYLKDNYILLETCGNVQRDKKGSAFLDCKADLFAYGFLVDNSLTEPKLFFTKPLQDWFSLKQHNYEEITTNTDGLYNTKFRLVRFADIPDTYLYPELRK